MHSQHVSLVATVALCIVVMVACTTSDLSPNCQLPRANQDEIVAFMNAGCFKNMAHDPAIRSSGPIVLRGDKKLDLSTHNRVRVYYSDGIVQWLRAGRPVNGIADGEVMIKEMFPSDTTQPGADVPLGYATMVRDSKGSVDGWYWSSYITLQGDVRVPTGKAGWTDCLNCHASTDNPDNTFAALEQKNNNTDKAIGIYKKCISLDPSGVNYFFQIGSLYYTKYSAAAKKFEALPTEKKQQPESDPESKALLDNLNAQADAVIDSWARFVALTKNNQAAAQTREQIEKAATELYKFRHPDSPTGFQDLVSKYAAGAPPTN